MSTLQERLAAAMKGPPAITAADLARACDVRPASVSEWVNGPTKYLRGTSAVKAAHKLGVSVDWLTSGRGPMRSAATTGPIAASETAPGYVRYQVMGEGGAGPGVINQSHPEVLQEVELAEWQVREEIGALPSPERVKLLTVRGQSMAPRIRNGDVVFVDIEDQQMHDGGLFVVLLHGHALVKRLEIRTDGLHIVSLATPERPDVVAPDQMHDVSIAGRVLGAIQLRRSEDL